MQDKAEVRGQESQPHVLSIITPQDTAGSEGNLDLTELKYACVKAVRDQEQYYVILIALLFTSYLDHIEGSAALVVLQHHHLVGAFIL